jgi:hypothetical protein
MCVSQWIRFGWQDPVISVGGAAKAAKFGMNFWEYPTKPKKECNCVLVSGLVASKILPTVSELGFIPDSPIWCPKNLTSLNPTSHFDGLRVKLALLIL